MTVAHTKRRTREGLVVTTRMQPKPSAVGVARALGASVPVLERRALFKNGKRIASTTLKVYRKGTA